MKQQSGSGIWSGLALFGAGAALGAGAGALGLYVYRNRSDYQLGYRNGYAHGANALLAGITEEVSRYGDQDGVLPPGFYDGYRDGRAAEKPATADPALGQSWQKALQKRQTGQVEARPAPPGPRSSTNLPSPTTGLAALGPGPQLPPAPPQSPRTSMADPFASVDTVSAFSAFEP
jgi:hypothetical protein